MVERSERINTTQVTVFVYVVLVWFLLVLGGSLLGVFVSGRGHPPLSLGLAVVVPIVVFLLGYFWSTGFRQFVLSVNVGTITRLQIYRVIGVTFLILYSRGTLPGIFALPAGWGDIAVGIAAPLVAYVYTTRFRFRKGVILAWNIFGILDLVVAISLGVLVSPSSIGILASTISAASLAMFPLSLIPTFLVPLSVILQLIGLIQLRRM